ncbi:DUF6049 family protein [Kineococcus sp. SYSU DK005]|uniref:DUF6049 family protein n=1 Tax=Kineococcus sp. SYSU DK005 TaxID=3383126 RepID=UPI003D7CDBA3
MSAGGAPAGPRRREVLAGLAGLTGLVGAPAAAAAGTASPTASPAAAALPLRVSVQDVTPTAYDTADPARAVVTVRARVRHGGGAALTGLRARLVAQRSTVVGRDALDRWEQASPTASLGRTTVTSEAVAVADGRLAAGGDAEVLLVLDAAALGTGEGAHPAAVEVLDGGGARAGLARTFLVSAPHGVRPTRLTLLLPLVAGRTADATGLAGATGGRLGRVLDASADPRTAWALDPAVLATAPARPAGAQAPGDGDGGAPAAGAAPGAEPAGQGAGTGTELPAGDGDAGAVEAALRSWRERLGAAAEGRAVLVLPHGDPDLAALAAAPGGAGLLGAATAARADAAAALGGATVLTDVAWPAGESADQAQLALAARAGARAVVLDDRCLPTDDELTYTPTGRADVRADGAGTLAGLVADSSLSALLQRADATADTTGGGAGADTALVQRAVAETATTTLQRPNAPRALLLVAPRSFDPRPGAVQRLVGAVEASGWASWQPLPELLATPVPDVERTDAPVTGRDEARAALPAAHVAAVAGLRAAVEDTASALQGADPATGALQRSALMLLAASWRGHAAELPAARRRAQERVEAFAGGVRLLPGSVINLAATRSELPVTVVNELAAPVRVDLVLRPRSPRVQLAAVPRVTVPAGGQQRVAVPVRALANGSVVVEAQLRTPAGTRLGEPVGIDVNVRADLEGWLTGLVGGGAGALLVAGVVRAVKRGRRRVDEVPHADVGGDRRRPPAGTGPAPADGAGAGDGPDAQPGAAGGQRPSAPTGQG